MKDKNKIKLWRAICSEFAKELKPNKAVSRMLAGEVIKEYQSFTISEGHSTSIIDKKYAYKGKEVYVKAVSDSHYIVFIDDDGVLKKVVIPKSLVSPKKCKCKNSTNFVCNRCGRYTILKPLRKFKIAKKIKKHRLTVGLSMFSVVALLFLVYPGLLGVVLVTAVAAALTYLATL